MAGTPELRDALSDNRQPLAARQDIVARLLDGKAAPATVVLARRAVVARERTFADTVDGYLALAAAQRSRAVATVRVAVPLTAEQTARLQNALNKQLGRPVSMHVVVDPAVLGGVRVEVGDEVIDGTVASRLDEARKLFS
ncbi:ATP synthase subunit delta [bioreactor metagenome]|uniref:ATP synthase subunit delta n=1 Tax=bioreactor metagenome TaxID=1076179 RepID=A0A645IPN5_9ZZZZ